METQWHGNPAIALHNDEFECLLLPTFGNNLIRLYDRRAKREVLRVPEGPAAIQAKPGHFGTPIMLPPNRIRNGRFKFDGRDYQMEVNTPEGHHIHGFLRNRAWTVVQHSDTSVTSEFLTTSYPEILKGFAHELKISCTYELRGNQLKQIVVIENQSKLAAPIGFGLHTWFLLDGEPQRWRLHSPASDIWALDADTMPSGELIELGKFAALNDAMPLAGNDFDTIFRVGNKKMVAQMIRDDGYTITYTPSPEYLHWVFYTKGVAKDFLCLEPYTWVTNAPNLDLPAALTGMRSLAAGESLRLTVDLQIAR